MATEQATLLPDVPRPLRRFQVTVTLPREDRDEALLPPGCQAVAELAAAAIAAEGLITAWTSAQAVLSMVVELPEVGDALAAGAEVARALGSGSGRASVTAEPYGGSA